MQDISSIEASRCLEQRIRYGMYPEIISSPQEDVTLRLKSLADSYLFKDILQFQYIKKSDFLLKLLQALALQSFHIMSFQDY